MNYCLCILCAYVPDDVEVALGVSVVCPRRSGRSDCNYMPLAKERYTYYTSCSVLPSMIKYYKAKPFFSFSSHVCVWILPCHNESKRTRGTRVIVVSRTGGPDCNYRPGPGISAATGLLPRPTIPPADGWEDSGTKS